MPSRPVIFPISLSFGIMAMLCAARLHSEPATELALHNAEGVVRVIHRSSGDSTVIEGENGERWILSEARESVFNLFENCKVVATGEFFTPKGQGLAIEHFRVFTMRLAVLNEDEAKRVVELSAEESFTGRFQWYTIAKEAKGGGETYLVFSTKDATFPIMSRTRPPIGRTVTIIARRVKLSPFTAGLWATELWLTADSAILPGKIDSQSHRLPLR